jgi:hypothetical protein
LEWIGVPMLALFGTPVGCFGGEIESRSDSRFGLAKSLILRAALKARGLRRFAPFERRFDSRAGNSN